MALLLHGAVAISWLDVPLSEGAFPPDEAVPTVRVVLAVTTPRRAPPKPSPVRAQEAVRTIRPVSTLEHRNSSPDPLESPPEPAAEEISRRPAPATVPEVSSPPPTRAGIASAQLPNPSQGSSQDEISAYAERVRSLIEQYKRYPPMARRRAIEGSVTARIAIAADGRITRLTTEGGAASLLARSTRDAIERTAPLPPPPAGFLEIVLTIHYGLDD